MTVEEFEKLTGPDSEFFKGLKEAAMFGSLDQYKAELAQKGIFLAYPVEVTEIRQVIPLSELQGLVEPETLGLLAMVNNERVAVKGFGIRVTMHDQIGQINQYTGKPELVTLTFERDIVI